ncbi:MAG: RNA polymerase sigma factor [Oscillospiraceae bacterium]|nr:RNA polymerase sigma factor [Oscillospiraceae bacterium]
MIDERRLLRRLATGDEEAFREIVSGYSRYVSTVIANQLRDFDNVTVIEELSADVFFELWRNRTQLTTTHLRGWLSTVARNKAKNYIRSQKIIFESLDETIAENIIDLSDDFSSLEKEEQAREIKSALDKIRKPEREVLLRYYYYNQPVAIIAEETGTNVATVKTRLQRGRAKLKEILEKGGFSK